MTPASSTPAAALRPRSVRRIRFHLDGYARSDALFEELLALVDTITPVCQPYPQD